ncbi:cupin domain-containing protein [Nonomuraea dietziae]|uniref:cupin domain-containing protein n=1 Tax=Nonomuraea dietziae TaxID=65515 RepID=UPI00361D01A3
MPTTIPNGPHPCTEPPDADPPERHPAHPDLEGRPGPGGPGRAAHPGRRRAAPHGLVPEHRHVNEQIGLCLQGTLTFRVGQETRGLGPGGTWRILAHVPHEAQAGPEGAVVVEVFAPVRDDWAELEQAAPATPRWPSPH